MRTLSMTLIFVGLGMLYIELGRDLVMLDTAIKSALGI